MSNKALNWAWKLPLKGSMKFVLIALADYANKDGICWPSIGTLSKKCGLSEACIEYNLKSLINLKIISKKRRRNDLGYQASNNYTLSFSRPQNLGSGKVESKQKKLSQDVDLSKHLIKPRPQNLGAGFIKKSKKTEILDKKKSRPQNLTPHIRTISNYMNKIIIYCAERNSFALTLMKFIVDYLNKLALELLKHKVTIQLLLKDNSLYDVTYGQCLEWSTSYPDVAIYSELMQMKEWIISNPSKRKTRRGVRRFITSWLSKTKKDIRRSML